MRLIAAFLLLIAIPAAAQQGFHLNGGLSWHWAASSNAAVRFLAPPRPGGSGYRWQDESTDRSGGSYGAGQAAYLHLGYRVAERWGAGLGARYVFSPAEQQFAEYHGLGTETTILIRKAANPLFLEPGVQVFLELGEKVEASLRAGVLVPVRHTVQSQTYTPDSNAAPYWQTSATLRTNFSVGGFGSGSLSADLGGGIFLFVQGGFGMLALRARDETVEAVVGPDGRSYYDALSATDQRVEYVNGPVVVQPSAPGSPLLRPRYSLPFSYWSVDIGVGWRAWR